MSREDFFKLLQLLHSFTPCTETQTFFQHLACRYITSYFQGKKKLWVFPDLLFFSLNYICALCNFTRSAYFTTSGCKKSKFEGICITCIVMIINFVFHKIVLYRLITLVFLALALLKSILYLCSGVQRVLASVTLLHSQKEIKY